MSQQRSQSEERPSTQVEAPAEAASQTRTTGGLTSYFPLGYKDAVHQWVGCCLLVVCVTGSSFSSVR